MKKLKVLFLALAVVVAFVCALPVLATETQPRDVSFENSLAADLKALGLFSGVSDTNFDLERAPSRTEVLVMLIRVLGEEKAVKEGTWEHPFTDVAEWANPYVGYAYEKGLTKGVSATKFGTDNASAATYLTFVLRALGYSDADGDFAWDNPYPLAKGLGLLPSFVDTENFWRADIVSVSYAALAVDLKGTATMLAEKLIDAGVFTAEIYGANYDVAKIGDKENIKKTPLTAEEVYAKCSPAVFYIEVQSESGAALVSGSGFFIDASGIAVTNWHVIDGADKAVITLPGSGAQYDVIGVYAFDPLSDYAVIQINGDNFKTLAMNPLTPRGAADVYAIGSPKGLQNTISAGIVSNPRRVLEDNCFIQTTAAISNGSSGGVLLNRYGEAIGITSNSYTDGQNLNFARPISCIAGVKTETATPLADVNWNHIRYEMESYELTVKVGEIYTVEYDMYYYTENDEIPSTTVVSSNPEVATYTFGFEEWFLRIAGHTPGTSTFTVTDSVSDSSLTFTVTVVENEIVEKNVQYFMEVDKIAMNPGAVKQYRIQGVALSGEAVRMRVITTDPKIKATIEYPEEYDFGVLTVSGSIACNGSITLGNDIDETTYVLPVTIGEQTADSYAALRDYLLEEGEFYSDGDTEYDHHYIEGYLNAQNMILMMYYPNKDYILLRYVTKANSVLMVDIRLDAEPGEVTVSLQLPSLGIYGEDTIDPEGFGDGKRDTIKFEKYEGLSTYKSDLEKTAPQAIVPVLVLFDYAIQQKLPALSISDFGFVDLDPVAYGFTD